MKINMISAFEKVDSLCPLAYIPLSIPGLLKTDLELYLEFIPYCIWSRGDINPLKEKELHKETLVNHFTIQMGEMPDISALVELIDGIVG